MYKYTKDFGLGANSGIHFPGEEMGIVHPVNKWSGRTRVTMAIGQEVSVTFLQMMVAFSTVANGGILIEPHIYSRICDTKGGVVAERVIKAKRRVISEDASRRLRRMMQGVVEYGTAKRCALSGLSIGGKTGTSQKIDTATGAYSDNLVWASFIGFAPVENPVLVCGVVLDEPAHGEGGGVAAAPAFRQIFRQIISHPNLEYAEKLIDIEKEEFHSQKEKVRSKSKQIPDMCGMDRRRAAKFLLAEGIKFEIIGTEQCIAYQSPPVAKPLLGETKLILYTGQRNPEINNITEKTRQIRVPNCVGKDLRDAVNALNLKGLVPYVKGAGMVKKQEPAFGTIVQSTVTCTLVCAFDG